LPIREAGISPADAEAKLAEFEVVLDHWGEGRLLDVFAPSVAANQLARRAFGTFERASVSPRMARGLQASVEEIDVTGVLGAISAPVLILHRREDWIDIAAGRQLAANIPGARLVELEGTDHAYFTQDSDAIVDHVERFLTGSSAASQPDRILATVLFTDRRLDFPCGQARRRPLARSARASRRAHARTRGRRRRPRGPAHG
jgi:pimeloyl-ACP methyl ester carboxylesterase